MIQTLQNRTVFVVNICREKAFLYFKSKDELILASLRKQDEEFRNWLMREVESRNNAVERLLAVFDVYEEWSRCSNLQ